MKLYNLLFIIIVILTVIFINTFNQDTKIYYVDINTNNNLKYNQDIINYLKEKNKLEKEITNYSNYTYKVEDILFDIQNNKITKINNKKQTIQNALIKADLLTISLDLSDNNKSKNIEKLFYLLRKYCKEKIYIIGYNNKNTTKSFDNQIEQMCRKYNIYFINTKTYYVYQTDKLISKKIIDNI